MKIFKTSGVCAREISFKIVDDKVEEVIFKGGCSGNTQGLSVLLSGMKVEDVVAKLSGLTCGSKESSCPDQLAKALKEYL
jgi:uncharacterized protein (TIGR03905 family)